MGRPLPRSLSPLARPPLPFSLLRPPPSISLSPPQKTKQATAGNVQQAADLFLAGGLPSVTAGVERDAELARSLAGGGGGPASIAGGPFDDPLDGAEEQLVRAPIPVMRDTLYGPAATYHRGGGAGVVSATAAGGGPSSSSYLPQRRPNDTRPQAAAAFSSADEKAGKEAKRSSSGRAAAAAAAAAQPRTTTGGLAGLFAPPADLLFSGDFQQAAEAAAAARRWLVANVQCEAEFASHRLNRDTWADPALKMLLAESFVFWQGDVSAEDGAAVARHYRLLPPAIAEAALEAAVSAGRGGGPRRGARAGDPLPNDQGPAPPPPPAAAAAASPPLPSEVSKLIPPNSLPAVLVVDPATGLAMRTWTGFVPAERLAEELGPFLDHAFDEPGTRELAAAGAAAARRRRQAEAAASRPAAAAAAAAAAVAGRAMTEEEELAAALEMSAAEARGGGGGKGGGGKGAEEAEGEEDEDFAAEDDDDDEIIEDAAAAAAADEGEKEEEEAAPLPPSSPPPAVIPEPAEGVPRLSVALRLPDGGRASRAFAKDGTTLADLFEWCRPLLLLLEQQEGENRGGSRRKFSLKEPFPEAVPMAREGAEGVSLESVCGGGGGVTFLLHFVD